jgi:predicted metal-dependent phosphoesterase TrpH
MSGSIVNQNVAHEDRGDGAPRAAMPEPDVRSVEPSRIDYHVHTCWSFDSETSLEALLARAQEARLSRICVTDHDTIKGALALRQIAPPDLDVIVGCEFSTDDGSQVIGLGLSTMIHEKRVLELMRAIRQDGGLVLVPHPFRRGSGLFRPEIRRSATFVDHALSLTDLVECFNGRDTFDNNERNHRFAVERGLPSVAGSDAHTADEIGSVFVQYPSQGEVDGRSERLICFPDRPRRREHKLKRTAMEFYHRNADRLPGPVTKAYRVAWERSHRTPQVGGVPRVQHELPAIALGPHER